MKDGTLAAKLFRQVADPFTAEALFDCLPQVVYFVKNDQAEYVVVNRTLAERCGVRDKRDLIGKTAAQAFPSPLGRSFLEQDHALLASGKPFLNQLELHLYPTGMAGWCLTNKFPLCNSAGQVIGIVGLSHDLHLPDESAEEYGDVAAAVRHARERLDSQTSAEQLASIAGLSVYQLDQRLRRLFRLTTGQFLLKLRMDAAADLLRDSTASLSEIGLRVGYSDQSAFSRQFRRTTGLTPGSIAGRPAFDEVSIESFDPFPPPNRNS